jgi:hypothetical protein
MTSSDMGLDLPLPRRGVLSGKSPLLRPPLAAIFVQSGSCMAEEMSRRWLPAFMIVSIESYAATGFDPGSLEACFKSEEHRQKFNRIDVVRTASQLHPIWPLTIG